MEQFITYLQSHLWFFILLNGIMGLCVGSFLNVVIYRFPLMLQEEWRKECQSYLGLKIEKTTKSLNLFTPSSHCTQCHKSLKWWHNIPLLSFLFLKGKCAYCTKKIAYRYPLIELLTASLFIGLGLHFGMTYTWFFALIFTSMLIALSWIDLDHQILPDQMTLSLVWLGLILSIYDIFIDSHTAILGGMMGYLILWLFAKAYELFTGTYAMGHGDFKLLAALGTWLGFKVILFVIICSSFLGAIIGLTLIGLGLKSKKSQIPFGPFLAFSGLLALVWGQPIMDFYLKSMGMA